MDEDVCIRAGLGQTLGDKGFVLGGWDGYHGSLSNTEHPSCYNLLALMTEELESALFAAATESTNDILRRVNLPVCGHLSWCSSLCLVACLSPEVTNKQT